MSNFDRTLIAAAIFALVFAWVWGWIEKRRQRSIEEFERKRRDRKAEVERAARKSL